MAKRKSTKQPKTAVLPIRLAPDLLQRLDSVAAKMGTNRSSLIVYLTQCFVEQFEASGEVILPLNWKRQIEAMDGRTKANYDPEYPALKAVKEFEDSRYPTHVSASSSLNEQNAAPKSEGLRENNGQRSGI